ncbi:MAG: SDR family NAD(P)-dependent oxidoreductase [Steroidobacteraceae bacterium]
MDPVLVVGIRGGVGAAVAEQLIQQGHTVVGSVRSQDQVAAATAKLPGIAAVMSFDMADPERTRQVLASRFDNAKLDGVIVCAAVSDYGPLETSSLVDFKRIMDVNATSCLAIYQACVPALRRALGRLVLVSSYSGRLSFPFHGVYQASKFALEALADVMRLEAAEFGVKVVVVEPGGIDTEMSRAMRRSIDSDIAALSAEDSERYGYLYRKFREQLRGATKLPTGADVAGHVVSAFAATDPEPRYVIGDDAQFLIAQRKVLSDREFDQLVKSL